MADSLEEDPSPVKGSRTILSLSWFFTNKNRIMNIISHFCPEILHAGPLIWSDLIKIETLRWHAENHTSTHKRRVSVVNPFFWRMQSEKSIWATIVGVKGLLDLCRALRTISTWIITALSWCSLPTRIMLITGISHSEPQYNSNTTTCSSCLTPSASVCNCKQHNVLKYTVETAPALYLMLINSS